jgi:hypothetical protein
MIDRG